MKSNAMLQAAFKCQKKKRKKKNACSCFTHSTGRQVYTWPSSEVLTIYKLFQKLHLTLYQIMLPVIGGRAVNLCSSALQRDQVCSLAQTRCRSPAFWHLYWVPASGHGSSDLSWSSATLLGSILAQLDKTFAFSSTSTCLTCQNLLKNYKIVMYK